jgi:hypothetical protein
MNDLQATMLDFLVNIDALKGAAQANDPNGH